LNLPVAEKPCTVEVIESLVDPVGADLDLLQHDRMINSHAAHFFFDFQRFWSCA
jgi:hypothetical protein